MRNIINIGIIKKIKTIMAFLILMITMFTLSCGAKDIQTSGRHNNTAQSIKGLPNVIVILQGREAGIHLIDRYSLDMNINWIRQ